MAVARKGAAKKGGSGSSASKGKQGTNNGNTPEALKAAAGLWKETPTPPPNSFGDIPDGPYEAEVEGAVVESGGKNRDRLQVKWTFRIKGPTHANRLAWSNTGLQDPQGIEFTKRYIATLGLPETKEIEDLPQALALAKGKRVQIQLKTKTTDAGTFQNTYLNKALDEAAATGETATEQAASFVGKKVKFVDGDNNEIIGTVKAQNGDALSVDDEGGETWEVGVADISIVDESEAAAPEAEAAPDTSAEMVGKSVTFKDDQNKDITGEVVSTDGEGNLGVKVGDEEWQVPASECTVVEPKPAATKGPVKKGPIKKK